MTTTDSLRSIFSFPEFEEMVNDDEFLQQPNSVRRSQSAPERLGDSGSILNQNSESLLPSLDSNGCGVKEISAAAMAALLRGEFSQTIDRYVVVDCRYDYEYTGGHIKTAINANSKQAIEALFQQYKEGSDRVVVIFHCEFSKHRGPNCCRYFRQIDRESNTYPALRFPEIYLLEGGYRKFYQQYPELCDPNSYVSMWDPKYSKECKESHKEFKNSWRVHKSKRSSGGRALFRERCSGLTVNLSRGSEQPESLEDSGCIRSHLGKDRRFPRSPRAFRHLVLDLVQLERKYFTL